MDNNIYNNATELQKNINSGKTKYNALTNNCADAVVKVVEKGTCVNLPTGISPAPNDKFNSIKKNQESVQNDSNKKIEEEKKKNDENKKQE